jgi:dimethylglycine dehydrogenase
VKTNARVVIVGGGVMGVGLLYHLALEGWRDVVLVEKGELTSGSTWHAAGQCPLFNGSYNLTKVHQYGVDLYPKLGQLTGHQVSWHGCGGLRLATTDEEVLWFKHMYGISKLAGYEAHIIGPSEIPKYQPFLDTSGVKAAFLTVSDGHVAPADITLAMAAGARKLGAEIFRRTKASDIKLLATGEWQVITDAGNITCEHVVNSAGSYCDVVASWTGHHAPISNLLHHYVITEPLRELIDLKMELPVVRDPYSGSYLREESDGILVGPYETATAHTCWNDQAPSWEFESELLPPELDRLMPWLEKASERMPLFANAGIKSVVPGAITHTPDGVYLSGPAHGPRNYWMHCGASIGICQGGGAGKYLAQWMVHGQAEISMREFDPRRFGKWADKAYTRTVAIEDYHRMYYCYKPGEQHTVGRGLRQSSLYSLLEERGAQFGQVFGWERPRWYDSSKQGEEFSWLRSNWFKPVEREALAVRERVGLMDLSTFSKFEVFGPDAETFMSRICANKLPAATGRITLGHLLTPAGFIESEITITRLSAGRFYVLSAAGAQLHDKDQFEWRKRAGEQVAVLDITDDFGVLVLAGPDARAALAAVTPLDVSNESFRWLTSKVGEVAGVADIRLLRVNYVGELGWELHCPMAKMPAVYSALMNSGAERGIKEFGTYAMNSLRMEKAYRGWGSELTSEVNMVEADLERFVDLSKDFIGKEATEKAKASILKHRLTYLRVESEDADCLGNEPVYAGNSVVGITTGGAYGFAVQSSLAFAYVDSAILSRAVPLEIMIRGERRRATVLSEPAWDPDNKRLKA